MKDRKKLSILWVILLTVVTAFVLTFIKEKQYFLVPLPIVVGYLVMMLWGMTHGKKFMKRQILKFISEMGGKTEIHKIVNWSTDNYKADKDYEEYRLYINEMLHEMIDEQTIQRNGITIERVT